LNTRSVANVTSPLNRCQVPSPLPWSSRSTGDDDLAWETATSASDDIDLDLWRRLAEHREASHPADALAVYTRVVDTILPGVR